MFLQTSVVSGALLVLEQCVTNRLCRENCQPRGTCAGRCQRRIRGPRGVVGRFAWWRRPKGERNWTWVLSNTQVKAISRGTKRLLQVVLRDQDTLGTQASKINLVSTDIKRSHRRRSGRRSGRAGVSTGSGLLILTGVFGLNGALRMWWTTLCVCLLRFDFVNNVCVVHDASGFLCGLICSHGDDMLGSVDSLFRCQDGGTGQVCRVPSEVRSLRTSVRETRKWRTHRYDRGNVFRRKMEIVG